MRRVLLVLVAASALAFEGASAQSLSYTQGQAVSPAYEGFEPNPDGSFDLIFGYMNRNWL